MKKESVYALLVSVICVILAANIINLNGKLNEAKIKIARVDSLESEVLQLRSQAEKQLKADQDMEAALEAVRKENEDLRLINGDLVARLKDVLPEAASSQKQAPAAPGAVTQ